MSMYGRWLCNSISLMRFTVSLCKQVVLKVPCVHMKQVVGMFSVSEDCENVCFEKHTNI